MSDSPSSQPESHEDAAPGQPDRAGDGDDVKQSRRDSAEELAAQIHEEFTGQLAESDWSRTQIQDAVRAQLDHSVPPQQARDAVERQLNRALGVNAEDDAQGSGDVRLDDLQTEETWGTVTVRVTQLWENDTDSITQVGVVTDGTDTMKFTIWESSACDPLEFGKTYKIQGFVTDVFNDRVELKITSPTEITPVETSLDEREPWSAEGFVVDISAVGEVTRCPNSGCPFRVGAGTCPTHGQTDGGVQSQEFRVVLDDGTGPTAVTVSLADIETLLDRSLPVEEVLTEVSEDGATRTELTTVIPTQLVGQPLSVSGPHPQGQILAESFDRPSQPHIEEVLKYVREQ